MDFIQLLARYHAGLWDGLFVTLRLCLIVWATGLAGGFLLGIAADRLPQEVGSPLRAVSFVSSSIPVLVLLFWAHYPLQAAFGVVIDPFVTASAVLSVLNVIGVAMILREALAEFPAHYLVAAKVAGLSERTALWRIQAPLVLRQVVPGLLTLQVGMLQATLFASLISVNELFRVAQHINAEVYQPVAVYTMLACFFLAICLPLTLFAAWFRQRFTRNASQNQEEHARS
jgi:polar amino acid transport system permease protein